MPSLVLHRISVVRVYLSIAAMTQDPAGQDPHQRNPETKALPSRNSWCGEKENEQTSKLEKVRQVEACMWGTAVTQEGQTPYFKG